MYKAAEPNSVSLLCITHYCSRTNLPLCKLLRLPIQRSVPPLSIGTACLSMAYSQLTMHVPLGSASNKDIGD